MKSFLTCILLILPICIGVTFAKVNVVTSTSDLAYFARVVGGNLVEVKSIASPTADLHYIEVRPSYMLKVKKADVVLKIGLELDMWMDKIIDGSRNSKLQVVDCSKYIKPLEVPSFKVDARFGDLHRYGNPHYWLTPDNIGLIMKSIVDGLSAADPGHSHQFEENRIVSLEELEGALLSTRDRAAVLNGKEVVFYHNSWPYFNAFTGIVAAAFIEPYPGVPSSPSHITEVIELVMNRSIKIIAVEPFFDKRVPEKIASETGAQVITLYPSVGGRKKNETYLEWLEGNINALIGAYR